MLEVSAAGFPSGTGISARMCGEGLRASMAGDPALALPQLVRASSTLTVTGTLAPLPELPAAVASIVAMHSGDLAAAATVLDAAIEGRQGGPAGAPRLRLLRAWAAMLAGEASRAREECALARQHPFALAPRDELFARSLEVGLARRADDLQALMRAWEGVREFIMTVGMGLFTLLPLGELVVAAARMRDTRAVEPALAEAWALLSRLGDPPLWSSTLRWACVQAGILANRPDELPPHAAALVRASQDFPLAAALAEAGRAWVRMLGGQVEATAAEAAATRLARAGLPWDGARLAAHAAGRAAERKDMLRLLQVARELYGDRAALTAGTAQGAQRSGDVAGAPVVVRDASPSNAGRDGTAISSRTFTNGSVRKRRARGGGARASLAPVQHVPDRRPALDARLREPAAVATSPAAAEQLARRLSEREREVVRLVLAGKTYAEIGSALFISPRTAEHHIARVRRRIGASSRSEMLDVLHSAFGGRQ
ncbi:helix-turn-helix transcriptional regulator [Pseudoclavibacter endophyticus]|uniref:Helix-turn-helix transcriptional regulator n=2 Tax=Pseudoclavibacter endophyticus TaxID=1778590 RepID=A0A6H9WQY9_9MICO|nr:helix-turn-helix transcriptional regulator [Pseudoclavibacter endophyticus]